jgi:(p)ppGpp synthase/HD superfamily hydrolase
MDKCQIKIESKERVAKQKVYLTGYFHATNMAQSIKAMEVATKLHCGERKGGQPEISHQFELVSYGLPLFEKYSMEFKDSLVAALFLHDTIEDIPEQGTFALGFFPKKIRDIVLAVTKDCLFKKTEEDYINYYDKIAEAPVEAIMVKMIDRLHNLESMLECPEIFNKKKREAYVQEVEKYMIPTAKITRKDYSEYYQVITFLIKELKTYIKFIKRINELDN